MSPAELRASGDQLRRLGDVLDLDAARLVRITVTSMGETAWRGGSAAAVRDALAGGPDSTADRLRNAAASLRSAADGLDARAAAAELAAARARQADEMRTRPADPSTPPPAAPVPVVAQ